MSNEKTDITSMPNVATMSAEDAFLVHLGWYHHVGDEAPGGVKAAQDLWQVCGAVWNNTKRMPSGMWDVVRDVIGNWREADDWEEKGYTFSGAARRIRPALISRIGREAA